MPNQWIASGIFASLTSVPRVPPSPRLRVFLVVLFFTLGFIIPWGISAEQKNWPNTLGSLVYIHAGDLWVRTLPGGPEKRLTFDADNSTPRWSPSGQWLAFRKGKSQIWVIRNDGTSAHPIHENAEVRLWAWSTRTDLLAYVVSGGLWRVNADGSDPLVLVPHAAIEGGVEDFFWNADGTWIVYKYSQKKYVAEDKWPWMDELGRISADGLVRVILTGLPEIRKDLQDEEEYFRPGYPVLAGLTAPEGEVLFWQGEMVSASLLADGVPLYAIPFRGGEPRMLAEDMLLYPDFWDCSPDGGELAITEGGGRETWSRKRIVVVHLGAGTKTVLTDEKTTAFSPVFSPDGRDIAYVAGSDSRDLDSSSHDGGKVLAQRRIWVMKNDGSGKRQLTNDADYQDERPLWSTDGAFILFGRIRSRDLDEGQDYSGTGDTRAGLWIVPAEGGVPELAADSLGVSTEGWYGYYGHIDWDNYFDWWKGPSSQGSGAGMPGLINRAVFVLLLIIGGGLIAWRRRHRFSKG